MCLIANQSPWKRDKGSIPLSSAKYRRDIMKEMYMDDVGNITAKAINLINSELNQFNRTLSIEMENKVFDSIFEEVELLCNNDYMNYN